MSFQTVAIVGATGNIGAPIAKSLLANKALKVKILTRADTLVSKAALVADFKAAGGQVIAVDYSNHASLVDALSGVEVVISAASGFALVEPQLALIKACKEARVKRFYPSEYGVDDISAPSMVHPIIDMKKTIRKAALDAGLQVVAFFTGAFSEWLLSPFYSVNHETKTVEIVGTGNEKFGSNRMGEIGQLLAESINHPLLQPATTTKAISPSANLFYFSAQGTTASFNDFLDAHEKATGTKWQRTHISIEDAEARVAKNNDAFADFGLILRIWIAKGLLNSNNNIHSQFHVKADPPSALFQ